MKILVIGGTRFFGIHTVNALLEHGHDVTIATRRNTSDSYGDKVERICVERTDAQMSFIGSKEAGEFMAYLVEQDLTGAVNGASHGTISVREILAYVEEKTGKKAILSADGEPAPYNGEPPYSINTQKAENRGYTFTQLKDWIYELLDAYIEA